MTKIKTRDAVEKSIKTLDKGLIASEKMKSEYIKAKRDADLINYPDGGSADEYAANHIEEAADNAVNRTAIIMNRIGKGRFCSTQEQLSDFRKYAKENFREKRSCESYRCSEINKYQNPSAKQGREILPRGYFENSKVRSDPVGRNSLAKKRIKTAENMGKAAIKTTEKSARAAKAAVKASQRTYQAAKETAGAACHGLKAAAKAAVVTIKAIIAGMKATASALIAGGWLSAAVIIVICLTGLLANSAFGIFFSGEPTAEGKMTLAEAVRITYTEYEDKIQQIKDSTSYDILEAEGEIADWQNVVAVYAVKVNTCGESLQEVVTMDKSMQILLSEVFWDINQIDYYTETLTDTTAEGNEAEGEQTAEKTVLHILVSHKSIAEISDEYRLNPNQRETLSELLNEANGPLWDEILGI